MQSVIKNTRIAGVCTAVPSRKVNFFETAGMFAREEIERIYATTGIAEIRAAPANMLPSDMCAAAAERLMDQLGWERSSIDLLVFVTQGPDVPLPATACLLQHRLGLSTGCAAYDVNLGCSGYVYGMWMASQLLAGSKNGRALLLVGDRSTGGLRPGDRGTVSLFGDAGSATAIERTTEDNPIYMVTGTDGRGAVHLNVKVGAVRRTIPILNKPMLDEDYEVMKQNSKVHLNGGEVFAFTLRVVPKLIDETLALAGIGKEDVDYYVFHQANKFILEHLARKMKLPEGRSPIDLEKWGNTSSASIPLTLCNKLGGILGGEKKKICLAGFGVGWSWAAAVLDMGPLAVAEVYEIPDDYPCESAPLKMPVLKGNYDDEIHES
ncbi:MAG: ketoacyl-ACP synthase III [Alphaproteobacteria bacterium]